MRTINIKAQSGAVLVLALVMLTVLTIVGVSSMSSSSLEMKVASNMQQRNIAFQAAQSRIAFIAADDEAASPIDFKIVVPDASDPDSVKVQLCNAEQNCPDDVNGEWTATAEVRYQSCGKGFGNSMEEGKAFSYRQFEVIATGMNATGIARSVQSSAIRFPVKACGDETL